MSIWIFHQQVVKHWWWCFFDDNDNDDDDDVVVVVVNNNVALNNNNNAAEDYVADNDDDDNYNDDNDDIDVAVNSNYDEGVDVVDDDDDDNVAFNDDDDFIYLYTIFLPINWINLTLILMVYVVFLFNLKTNNLYHSTFFSIFRPTIRESARREQVSFFVLLVFYLTLAFDKLLISLIIPFIMFYVFSR